MKIDQKTHHRSKIGQLLIEHGLITDEHLNQALDLQQSTGKRLGEIFVEMELVAEKQINRLLRKQKRIRVLALVAAAMMTPFQITRADDLAASRDIYTATQQELITTFESRFVSANTENPSGINDIAQIAQNGGDANLAIIVQSGQNDKASIDQNAGVQNAALISQSGNNQTASISQSGNHSIGLISQR